MSERHESTGVVPLDRDEVEDQVTRVWKEILGQLPSGERTHFFDVGGQSLAAMRMINRLRQNWGVTVPMRLIFDHPVLADFATAATAVLAESART